MRVQRPLAWVLLRAAGAFQRLARWVCTEPDGRQALRVRPWFAVQGDKTLRVNYDLTEHSLVFDLGGYEGQWASDISAMYCCRIHVFEPVPQFADRIARRFAKNPRIQVHRLGLAGSSRSERICVSADGSSIYKHSSDGPEIQLIKAGEFIKTHNLRPIDLMKINIEGGEYELLEHLIEEGLVADIANIQVQFHDFIPGAQARMEMIQQKLRKTHSLTYLYPFVWENWRLNES